MIDKLKELLNNSRSDYFHFNVSAAIVTKDNRVLKKDTKSNTIELDIFYKVYKKISVNSKIEGTK